MLETTAYPLLGLKLLGTICPCLEKKEDTPARHAAWAVRTIPIRWHRRPRPASNNSEAGVSGFLSAFGAALGAAGGGGGGSAGRGGKTTIPLVGATLSIVDSPSGPRLIVSPPNDNNDANYDGQHYKHLNIVYSTLRWWNMPMLYSYHHDCSVKSDSKRKRD